MNGPLRQTNPYLKTKIMTASPEELRLMLFDGAIKFCHQAREAIDRKDFEGSYHALMRAQKIVLELSTSLDHKKAPDICEKLAALYTYIYKLLVDANVEHDARKVEEAVELLGFERETWALLMQRVKDDVNPADKSDAADAARQTAISSLSQSA